MGIGDQADLGARHDTVDEKRAKRPETPATIRCSRGPGFIRYGNQDSSGHISRRAQGTETVVADVSGRPYHGKDRISRRREANARFVADVCHSTLVFVGAEASLYHGYKDRESRNRRNSQKFLKAGAIW